VATSTCSGKDQPFRIVESLQYQKFSHYTTNPAEIFEACTSGQSELAVAELIPNHLRVIFDGWSCGLKHYFGYFLTLSNGDSFDSCFTCDVLPIPPGGEGPLRLVAASMIIQLRTKLEKG
jgi:hypothetical protein